MQKIEFIKSKLDRSLIFIGLMGAGKTSLGRKLANKMNMAFIDADDVVVEKAGMSIPDIFEQFGEPRFRDLEKRVIAELISDTPKIISLGGGAVMNQDTAGLVFSNRALSVWLKTDTAELMKRVGNKPGRPLLKSENPEEVLEKLMDERAPVYSRADLIVVSEGGLQETLDRTVLAVHDYLQQN